MQFPTKFEMAVNLKTAMALGIDVPLLKRHNRPLCRTFIDWSERRHHLGGSIGAANPAACGGAVVGHAQRRSRVVTFSFADTERFAA